MTAGISNSRAWNILSQLATSTGAEGKLKSSSVEQVMSQADLNDDGVVTEDEFVSCYKSSSEYQENQREYDAAFKAISTNNGDGAFVTEADIEEAIKNFLDGASSGVAGAAGNAAGASSGSGAGSSIAGAIENTAKTLSDTSVAAVQGALSSVGTISPVSLTGDEPMATLESGRRDTLSALNEARTQKASLDSLPEMVAANEEVAAAQKSYDDSLTALEQREGQKTETEQAVLDQKVLKDENDALLNEQSTLVSDLSTQISEQNQTVSTLSENLTSAQATVNDINASLGGLGACPPATITTTSTDEKGNTVTTTSENPAYAAWQAEKAALEAQLADAQTQLEDVTAQLDDAEAQLANMELDLAEAEAKKAELETTQAEIDAQIAEIIETAEAAGEAVSEELQNVSKNLTAANEAKHSRDAVRVQTTLQLEAGIAQLQQNLAQYTDAISASKSNEALKDLDGISKSETALQKILDDPEISTAHKMQILGIVEAENPDAVEKLKEENPEFTNSAISDFAADSGVSEEEVKEAALADMRAEIDQRREELKAEQESRVGFGKLWDSAKGLFGFGTQGQLDDLDEMEQLYADAEANPTSENLDKLNKELNGQSVDWAATAQSVETMKALENGGCVIDGQVWTREEIAQEIQKGIASLETNFDESCENAGFFTQCASEITNFFGFGTTQNMTKAQINELKDAAATLSDPNASATEFAAAYKQITGQSLTGSALSQMGNPDAQSPVENSRAAASVQDYEDTNKTIKNTAVTVLCAAATVAIPGVGGVIAAAALTGACTVGVNAIDAATQKNGQAWETNVLNYLKEDGLKDLLSGAIAGASGKIGNAAGNYIQSLTSKGADVATRIAGRMAADFVDGSLDGALSGASDYVITQAFDGEKIELGQLFERAGIGAAFGGVMNVGMGAALGHFSKSANPLADSSVTQGLDLSTRANATELKPGETLEVGWGKNKTAYVQNVNGVDCNIKNVNGRLEFVPVEGSQINLQRLSSDITSQMDANNAQILESDDMYRQMMELGDDAGADYFDSYSRGLRNQNSQLQSQADAIDYLNRTASGNAPEVDFQRATSGLSDQIDANNAQILENDNLYRQMMADGDYDAAAYYESLNRGLSDQNAQLQGQIDSLNHMQDVVVRDAESIIRRTSDSSVSRNPISTIARGTEQVVKRTARQVVRRMFGAGAVSVASDMYKFVKNVTKETFSFVGKYADVEVDGFKSVTQDLTNIEAFEWVDRYQEQLANQEQNESTNI